MILFLYGEDSFRRKKKYAEIISEFVAKNGNLGLSEFSSEDVNDFINAVKNRSIFSPRTLISIKDIDIESLSSDTRIFFENTLIKIIDSTEIIVLITSVQTTLAADISFLNNPSIKIQEFKNLSKDKLIFFVTKKAVEKGIKISEIDAQALIDSLSGDLWQINSELDKLVLAKSYDPFTHQETAGYFELLNTIKFSKEHKQKLIALETILYKLKEDPARVFNGLAYSSPRGHIPYKWFGIMADYDIAVKSGKMDYEDALLDFVIR